MPQYLNNMRDGSRAHTRRTYEQATSGRDDVPDALGGQVGQAEERGALLSLHGWSPQRLLPGSRSTEGEIHGSPAAVQCVLLLLMVVVSTTAPAVVGLGPRATRP